MLLYMLHALSTLSSLFNLLPTKYRCMITHNWMGYYKPHLSYFLSSIDPSAVLCTLPTLYVTFFSFVLKQDLLCWQPNNTWRDLRDTRSSFLEQERGDAQLLAWSQNTDTIFWYKCLRALKSISRQDTLGSHAENKKEMKKVSAYCSLS